MNKNSREWLGAISRRFDTSRDLRIRGGTDTVWFKNRPLKPLGSLITESSLNFPLDNPYWLKRELKREWESYRALPSRRKTLGHVWARITSPPQCRHMRLRKKTRRGWPRLYSPASVTYNHEELFITTLRWNGDETHSVLRLNWLLT